ncbi:MAG TPA: replicative DNA helicase, partial [Chloroflexi bacterium]|nr:replicative DNA helicase [Chloroflexota bacterium]
DRIDNLYRHRGELLGVPSGFSSLDHLLGGFQKSDFLILAARPGVGKTSLMLSFALHAAQEGKVVALFSLEMSAEQLVQRLVSQISGINAQRLRLGQLEEDEWPAFSEAIGLLSELPMYIDDTPSITVIQLRTKCRRLASEHGLDIIFVDYLQLMDSEVRSENRVQEVSYISRSLKGLAREIDVPVMTASQLSRAVEQRQDKRPVLSDLRESGSLEQDADIVMFIYREELYKEDTPNRNIADIIIAKHRSGPTGTIQLYFNKELTKFADVYTRVAPDEYAVPMSPVDVP